MESLLAAAMQGDTALPRVLATGMSVDAASCINGTAGVMTAIMLCSIPP